MNKKQQKLLYFDRKEKMCNLIDELYNLGCDEAFEIAKNYQDSIFEMFRVTEISLESIELTHLFSDEVYGPVFVNPKLRSTLDIEDVFLLIMGLQNNKWHMISMSQPYSSSEFSF